MRYKYTVTCSCGQYTANFENDGVARSAALMHFDYGTGHVVTCTRPAENDPWVKVPVFVVGDLEKNPVGIWYAN